MRFSFFYHSLVSDWNHGNAHFLRGVVSELLSRGHKVQVFEPADGWSRQQLLQQQGNLALADFHYHYPQLSSILYQREGLDWEQIAQDSDVIIVHEWNEPWLVNGFGELHNRLQQGNNCDLQFTLLFHDTHHRMVSDRAGIRRFRLEHYDGILAFGDILRDAYRHHGWHNQIWTWHEAADTRMFFPRDPNPRLPEGDLIWIGNWGDDERARELRNFLFDPVRDLKLECNIYGVRYPNPVLKQFAADGITYRGWLANHRVPELFANHRVTVHVPRRYYVENLPGIPTIRPFEAMACGIPLICSPWHDIEQLFSAGEDYLVAATPAMMLRHLRAVLHDDDLAQALSQRALATIRRRHTCAHRVDELLAILAHLQATPQHPQPHLQPVREAHANASRVLT